MAIIIDGKKISGDIKQKAKQEVQILKSKNISVKLVVILVGKDPASQVYVKYKTQACELVGIESIQINLKENTSQKELLDLIDKLNSDITVNGILLQLPIPKHINEYEVLNAISPLKDVDCFHSLNVGKLALGIYDFAPCTPAGIIDLLDYSNIEICGKNCVIVGRSNIVGKPLSMLMMQKNATVTVCHSKTKDLAFHTKNADILVAAIGKANFIGGDLIKKGAVVIDVGINRLENKKLCGDVDFSQAVEVCGYITPVPGGVGPMTIAKLMQSTVTAAKLQNKIF